MDFQDIYRLAASLWVVWLMIVFVAIVAWAFWPSHRQRFKSYGEIPFKDDDRET